MTGESRPRLWLLLSDKQGDNRQVLTLASWLEHPYQIRRVYPQSRFVLGKPFFRASIAHLDTARSDALVPPWPDVLITIGRRPTMAAMWIRRQSGNRTRIILLGRQPRYLDRFALVVSGCQYVAARDPRILRIGLPLDEDGDKTDESPRGDATALLIGGPTRTFRLLPEDALRMLDLAARNSPGKPLLILTSRRTPAAVVDALASRLPTGATLLRWQPGQPAGSLDYARALAGAARFVVTGDSISMLSDVVRIGAPLAIFRLSCRNTLIRLWHDFMLATAPIDDGRERRGPFAALLAWIVDRRVMRLPRSFDAFHAFLIAHGCASDLETQGFLSRYSPMPEQDRLRVVGRVREVLDRCTNSDQN